MRLRLALDKLLILAYFTGLILAGSALLALPGVWNGQGRLSYLDALFTATSAVCVTGLITVDTASYSVFGQALIGLLIQLGGLGIISFATLYIALPRRRISLLNRGMIKDLYMDEVESNPKTIIRHIVAVTFSFEALGFLVFFPRFRGAGTPRPAFDAAFHAVSAFCNAGFSTLPDNLERFAEDPWVTLAALSLLVSGGVGFLVLQDLGKAATDRRRRLSDHSRVVLGVSASLLAAAAVFFFFTERNHAFSGLSGRGKILAALFQAATPRTAGFNTVPQTALAASSLFAVLLLMFIGGSPGSTAGGVKTTTFFVLASAAFGRTDRRWGLKIRGRTLPPALALKSFGVLGKAVCIVFLSALALLAAESEGLAAGRFSFLEIFFEAVSAFGTVGLSLGVTARLGAVSKSVLILTMFAGRVGLFAMSLPSGRERVERFLEYPDANLMIG